jgi:Trk-type K+ transport system membrane component
VVGVLFVLASLGGFAQISLGMADDPIMLVMVPLILLFGIGFIVLSRMLKRGRDTRIALTAIGTLMALFWLWSVQIFAVALLLLVVPAIVLQYRADSGRSLATTRGART